MARKFKVLFEDHIGKTYGELTVLSESKEGSGSGVYCNFMCSCGEVVTRKLVYVVSGNTSSCGCRGARVPTGTIKINKQGLEYEVIGYTRSSYRNTTLVNIKFAVSGYEKTVGLKEMVSGSVKDVMHKSIANVGFIGEGEYRSKGKDTYCYQTWLDMLKRCYSPKTKSLAKIYEGVTVCDSWHNYQNFAKWFYEHYVEGFRLDKDLQDLTQRCYSPSTCTFVPIEINSFFTGGLKRGIYFSKDKGLWVAQCQDGEKTATGNKKQTYLGAYHTEEEALCVYKAFKKSKLDKLVNQYRDYLTEDLIHNMYTIIDDLK